MENRITKANNVEHKSNVLYLMRRDYRLLNNYSIELGYALSESTKSEFMILANLDIPENNEKLRTFMDEGCKELDKDCTEYNIHFYYNKEYKELIKDKNVDCIVTKFSPLRENVHFNEELTKECKKQNIALYICDSHNIVPCKLLSKYVRSANGVKTQLYKFFDEYYVEFSQLKPHPYNKNVNNSNKFANKKDSKYYKGGYKAGMNELKEFIEKRFREFKKLRNHPGKDHTTHLSPWILSGQLGAQAVLLQLSCICSMNDENLEDVYNEIFIWKETGEHFCYHEKNYDNLQGALDWAKNSLETHRTDDREFYYKLNDLENNLVEDNEWRAGFNELKETGMMHLYVFLYWCKKNLFLTNGPDEALEFTFSLVNKHSLVANKPYTILWVMYCICGSMDQGWAEREVIGKIRCIKGIKSKEYERKWSDEPKK